MPLAHVVLAEELRQLAAPVNGTFAFWVHDLATGERAVINEQVSFPSASVIKLPIMLRLLELVQIGETTLAARRPLLAWHKTGGAGLLQFFQEGTELTLGDACTAMIALSDNTATNFLLDVTGIAPVNELLDRLGCPRTRLHRYFGKPDMPGPPGPSQAVPAEIGHLLVRLANRQVLTPSLCQQALLMLRRQTHRALAPRYLPEGTVMAHKTGSLDGVRHDVGLIWLAPDEAITPPRDVMALPDDALPAELPIVFVAMSKDVADLRWTVENDAERLIGQAALATYRACVDRRRHSP